MERAQLVKEYCKANPTPVQELCPEINQYFCTQKGYEIWNSRSFIRKTVKFNPGSWQACQDYNIINSTTPRAVYEGFYVHYIKELDALEMARVFLKGNRGKDGEEKCWSYGDCIYSYYSYYSNRFFLFHDDTNVYLPNGNVEIGSRYYNKFVINSLSEWMSRSFTCIENYTELKKFTPKVNFDTKKTYWGWDRGTHIPQVWEYREWYRRDFVNRKMSNKTKKLLDYDFEDVEFAKVTEYSNAILFQQISDDLAVLRCYEYSTEFRPGIGWTTQESKTEVARLFVPSKGNPSMIANENGSWKLKSSTPWKAQHKAEFVNFDEMENYPRLKYILPCINKDDSTLQSFVNILRHPIIEQIYKAGYPNIAKLLSRNNTIGANLKFTFGIKKEKKLPMFKLLGVNKFVMNAAETRLRSLEIIRELKFFAGGFDATKLNQENCELIANYVGDGAWYIRHITELVPDLNWRKYNDKYERFLTEEQKKWVIRLLKMNKKYPGCEDLYRDAISIYDRINNKPDVDLYGCRNYSEINRLHDAFIDLQIQEEAERRAMYDMRERERLEKLKKNFEKLQEDRIAKFEFENDDYCIRVPHELTEITKEGVCLHHCVGGYVDRHANGNTNIIFLRRKEAEDVPFYTIEIDNGNNVIQIHGYGNRWLGNNPEVVSFVYTYLNKIGANYDNKLLLNKGIGYGASNDNLDESYLKTIA